MLEEVRSLSADAARSAALLASQAERVDQLASRVTHRFDEFAASPLREGLSLVRMIVKAFTGNRQGGTQAPRAAAPRAGGLAATIRRFDRQRVPLVQGRSVASGG